MLTIMLLLSLFITTLSPFHAEEKAKRRPVSLLSIFRPPPATAPSRSTGNPDPSSDLEDRIGDRLASSRIGSLLQFLLWILGLSIDSLFGDFGPETCMLDLGILCSLNVWISSFVG